MHQWTRSATGSRYLRRLRPQPTSRTTATVAESDQTTITSSLGTTGIDYTVHPYISRCIESLSVPAVPIKIDSEIPVGSGLGSSAAAVIAMLGALNAEVVL
ncbi:MAG: hypothetical protein J7J06_02765 [Methanosarcinales archaeon]|nr:hypothetical protein [Methanosarcinales archaeon]